MNREDHPAWELYDLWRTAKLNVRYHSIKINRLEILNKFLEISLAITASGGVAALWFWETQYGIYMWRILLVIAAFSSVIKPTLNLVEKIKKMETCLSGYLLLVHDTEVLIGNMKRLRAYNDEIINGFKDAFERKGVLISLDPFVKEDKNLTRRLTAEINKELSTYSFYIPQEVHNARSKKSK